MTTTLPTQATPSSPVALTHNGHDLLFPALPYDITARAGKAAADRTLQAFVNKATTTKDYGRRDICSKAFGEHYDDVRTLAGQIKQHTLDHLDYYLELFTRRAREAGAQVHFAATAQEANDICLDIARKNRCKLCVKSKSMVTEETHLVPQLEAIGVETVETDLGEFIIQLDGDAPSHIVQPMIHKDRRSVARTFQAKLGAPYTEDAGELTQIARDYLRQKYRDADLGISGGNFLVANSGSVVICTNEGNGRLSTSAPKVHVAFVGIEKLVPDFEHVALLLKLLARSATAQPLTVYTHFMTGPKRAAEPDGPEQMHIILVDNGRTEVLREETREMLRCIRCGACLNACPVYRKIGGHAYGSVYSGPIGAILTPMLRGLENYPDLPYASSLCGACYEACPVKINIPQYLIKLRAELIKRHVSYRSQRIFFKLWAGSLQNSVSYRLGGWGQKVMFRLQSRMLGTLGEGDPYSSRGWLSNLPGMLGGWTSQRDMPTPPARSFRQWWHRDHQAQQDRPQKSG